MYDYLRAHKAISLIKRATDNDNPRLIDSEAVQKALKNSIPMGEIVTTGLGAGLGGIGGYLLSKILHKNPDFRTKLLYILAGGGLGGVAGNIYVNRAAPSGKFEGSKSLKEDMILADAFNNLSKEDKLKYKNEADMLIKNKPSTIQKNIRTAVPLAVGTASAGYGQYKHKKNYADMVNKYNETVVNPFLNTGNIKYNSKGDVEVAPILDYLDTKIDSNVGYSTKQLPNGESIRIPKEMTTNIDDLLDPSIERRIRAGKMIKNFSDGASSAVLINNIINKNSDNPYDTQHTGMIAGGLLGLTHNPANLIPGNKFKGILKLLGVAGSAALGSLTDSSGYEKK